MFRKARLSLILALLTLVAVACGDGGGSGEPTPAASVGASTAAQDPWALPAPPPASEYDGPLFKLSHDYPDPTPAPPDPIPWRQAINNGTIDTGNAGAYMKAVKDYIAADMKQLLFDYPSWDAAKAGWYNMPWLFGVREPIHGTYQGSGFPKEMFPQSGLTTDMVTQVLVYYNDVASGSLSKVWGTSGDNPVPGIDSGGVQFPEGSVVVKPAFTTANGTNWPPMQDAFTWQTYIDGIQSTQSVQDVSLFQFDMIVKDSASAPKTQWVFSTLVYDKDAPGDMWDKMVPLGAMWGNDPDVVSPQGCDYTKPGGCPALSETWINQSAPLYARETLGWGGRLSGPNDGAVDIAAVLPASGGGLEPYSGRYAMSSCMGCHGPAEYKTKSFLLPVTSVCQGDSCRPASAKCTGTTCTADPNGDQLIYLPSGSDEFKRWFQDRPGTEAQDAGSTALDYDMNYAFKAIPAWFKGTNQPGELAFIEEFNNYRGLGRRFKDPD